MMKREILDILISSNILVLVVYYKRIRRLYILLKMEGIDMQKKMYTSQKRCISHQDIEKIFNVRKLPYKQFDNQKFLKANCSPLSKQQPFKELSNNVNSPKNMEYHYQLAIMTSPAYKELHNKYKSMKEQHRKQKQEKLRILREKDQQLTKYLKECRRLEFQQERLLQKREQLKDYIEQLRYKRSIDQERNEQYRIMNMENLRNMMMAMHYQGGMDIDPDNMTYQQLLQLEEKMGKVSKGLTEDQYQEIHKIKATKEHEQQLCSICYYNIKQEEEINCLPCKHIFHCDCIKEWLLKQKQCPMCKQELTIKRQ